jgi:hypothetical protein
MSTTAPAPVTCTLTITDALDEAGNPGITVEAVSNNVGAKESYANLFAAWFGVNWPEMWTLFLHQARVAEEERTGAQPIAKTTSGPRLLGADGRVISSDEGIRS